MPYGKIYLPKAGRSPGQRSHAPGATRGRPRQNTVPKKLYKQISTVINKKAEHKYLDTTLAQNIIDAGTVTKLTSVPAGTTDITRTGDKLSVTSLHVCGLVEADGASACCRLIFFQWHPDDGVDAPVPLSILQTATFSSHYDHDHGSNYKILSDKTFPCSITGKNQYFISYFINGFKPVVKYHSAGVQGQDNIYLLTIGDKITTDFPDIKATTRLSYVDF